MKPKDIKKAKREAAEQAKRIKMIANQWQQFSKTAAYKDYIQFCDDTQAMFLQYSEEMVMPSPVGKGEQITITGENAIHLLQNRRGVGIVKAYTEGYVNLAG